MFFWQKLMITYALWGICNGCYAMCFDLSPRSTNAGLATPTCLNQSGHHWFRHQAITWTNVDLLSIGTHICDVWIKISYHLLKIKHYKIPSAKYQRYCTQWTFVLTTWITNEKDAIHIDEFLYTDACAFKWHLRMSLACWIAGTILLRWFSLEA